MFQNFVAEVQFATPLIANRPIVGDSLLAGIAFQRHGDWKRAISELPIGQVEGVPQVSVMLPYNLATRKTQPFTITRSIMHDMDHNPDMADMLNKMPPRSSLTPAKGVLVNLSSTYSLLDIPKLYFIGNGDIDAVEAALKSVPFIGTQKAKGFGQVAGVNVWPASEAAQANKWFGLIGVREDRNIVLRPIPCRLASLLPAPVQHAVSNETWHNPYDTRHTTAVVEPCMVPIFVRGEGFTEFEIEDDLSRVA